MKPIVFPKFKPPKLPVVTETVKAGKTFNLISFGALCTHVDDETTKHRLFVNTREFVRQTGRRFMGVNVFTDYLNEILRCDLSVPEKAFEQVFVLLEWYPKNVIVDLTGAIVP